MKAMFNSLLLNDFIKKSKMIKSEGIQIRDVNGKIQLINCDLENQVTTDIIGEIYEAGSLIMPKDIFSLIKDNQPMTITNDYIEIGSRKINYDFKDEYYPVIEDVYEYNVFDLNDKEIKTLLEVEHAISTDKTKPILNGIRIQDNKFITIDGYRMCERIGNFNSDVPITISNYKMLKSLKGQIKATCSDKHINYQVGNYNFSNRLIKGDFIEVDKLKPREHKTVITVNKKELEEILKSLNKVTDKVRNSLVNLTIRDNILHIKASNDSVSVEDSMKCDTKGEYLDIAFNCRYLLEAIKNMHSSINMKFTNQVNPVIIESPGKYELILPVRTVKEVK